MAPSHDMLSNPPTKDFAHKRCPLVLKYGPTEDPTMISAQTLPLDQISQLRDELQLIIHEISAFRKTTFDPLSEKLRPLSLRQESALESFSGALSDEEVVPPSKRKRKEKPAPRRRGGTTERHRAKPKPETTARKEKKDKELENPAVRLLNDHINQWLGLPPRNLEEIKAEIQKYTEPSRFTDDIPPWPPVGNHYSERWIREDEQNRQELMRLVSSMSIERREQLFKDDPELSLLVNQAPKFNLVFKPETLSLQDDVCSVVKSMLTPANGVSFIKQSLSDDEEDKSLEDAYMELKARHQDVFDKVVQAKNHLKQISDMSLIRKRRNIDKRWNFISTAINQIAGVDSKKKSNKSTEEVAVDYVSKMINMRLIDDSLLKSWKQYRPLLYQIHQNVLVSKNYSEGFMEIIDDEDAVLM
ncbi:hypothetical protein P9112_000319 [Eukaryota sp. TZLM1-RC]